MIRILLSTRLGERRMTQSDLARVTGIRSQTINELYHDFAERVNLDDLDLICEALDCDLEDLIVREPNIERRVKEVRHIPQTVSKSRKKYPPISCPDARYASGLFSSPSLRSWMVCPSGMMIATLPPHSSAALIRSSADQRFIRTLLLIACLLLIPRTSARSVCFFPVMESSPLMMSDTVMCSSTPFMYRVHQNQLLVNLFYFKVNQKSLSKLLTSKPKRCTM